MEKKEKGLFDEIEEAAGKSKWLFPSPKLDDRPIVRTAVNYALDANRKNIKLDHFSPHDLRRTAASRMTEIGIARLVVAKVLNHTDREITGVYDRHTYLPEKRHALETWGTRLREIITGEPATTDDGKVVALR